MSDFGLRIGIEGERDFKAALREINQSFKVLGSEMQLVTSQFDKNDKSVQSLTSRNAVLRKEIDTQKDKIDTLKSALDNASTSFGENDSRTKNWQIQLNKAQAELNGMERELKDNEKALDNVGDEMADTGKETDNLGKEMDDTGKKASIFGDVLKASLAAEAIIAGLKAVVNTVKEVGAAVKEYVTDSMEMAAESAESQKLLTTVMRNMMDATDDEVDSLLELAAAQEKVGVVSKTAQTTALAELASFVERRESLEDMLPVMNDYIAYQYGATASAEQARNVATSLGKAIDGNIDGLSKQGFKLTQAEKEWFKTATEMERTAFVIDMVSESMDGVNTALAQTDAGKMANLKTVLDNTKISVGTMANEFKAQILGQMLPSISALSESFVAVVKGEGSVEELATGFDDVFTEIVDIIETFLPQLIRIGSELVTSLVRGISNNMGSIIGGAMSIINQLVRAIVELLPIVLDAGVTLLFGLIDGIIQVLPSLIQAAVQIISTLVQGLTDSLPKLIPTIIEAVILICNTLIENLPLLLDTALQLVVGLTQGILDAIPVLVEKLPEIIIAIVDFIIGAIPQIIDAGIKLLTSLVTALPQIISAIVNAIPQIINGIITAVLNSIPQLIQAGIRLLVSLIQALPQIITTIVKAIPQIVTGLVNAVVQNIPKIIQAGVQLLISLVKNLPTIIAEIVKAIPQIITGLVSAIVGFVPELARAGLQLIQGVWQGISDAGAWLRDKISGFFGGVVSSIKKFFGISSPSTLFRDLFGKNMALGIGVGFAEEMAHVADDMQKAIPTTLDSPDLNFDAGITTAISNVGIFGAAVSLADVVIRLDGLAVLMSQMIEALDLKIVLDDGTLVGKLAPEIDRNLALLRKRGYAF